MQNKFVVLFIIFLSNYAAALGPIAILTSPSPPSGACHGTQDTYCGTGGGGCVNVKGGAGGGSYNTFGGSSGAGQVTLTW